MGFAEQLNKVLLELNSGISRIVSVQFIPVNQQEYAAEAMLDDGLKQLLFRFDPAVVSFAKQELVGLTVEEAYWLKDKKTDEAIGAEPI